MKQFRQTLMICLILLIAGQFAPLPFAFSASIDDYDVDVNQLHLRNFNTPVLLSTQGLITIGYTPETDGYYLHVIALDKEEEQQWIVRNLYIPNDMFISSFQNISVRICFGMLGFVDGEWVGSIPIEIHRSNNMLTGMPEISSEDFESVGVDTLSDNAQGDETTVDPATPLIDEMSPFPEYEEDTLQKIRYRGCAVPNIDLDDSEFPDDLQYAGDRNACGPASAANSLKWLSDTNEEITIESSTRDILNDLSKFMGRMANSGVTIRQFISGKLDYIHIFGLPINVKFQSESIESNVSSTSGLSHARCDNTDDYPTWDYLKQQIDDDEDVEVMYYWWDGEKWRGHAVCLTGYRETAKGLKSITFKHDIYQSGTGGTIQERDYIVIDSHGRMVLRKRRAYIGHIVAESPGSPFPVEMSLFNAFVKKNSVFFEWETVSETNNYGFEIFRNSVRISFIAGQGTTAETNHYRYEDKALAEGTYHYEVYQIDYDGTRNLSGTYEAKIGVHSYQFALAQNYPNPFNATTLIRYSLAKQTLVTLRVYNLLGKVVATLVQDIQDAGNHKVNFDAKALSSGIYYYRLETEDFTDLKKFILIK